MTCHAEQERDCFGEYEMQNEHKSVSNSVATRCRIQASLEVYRSFFKSREGDVLFKKQMDLVLKALAETKQQDDAGDEKKEPETVESPSKTTINEKPQPEKIEEAEPVVAEPKTDASACQPPKQKKKPKKVDKNVLQLYKNMKLLEKTLEENPEVVSCVHTMAHKKFEPEVVAKDLRPVDKERLNELAKPTETRLRNTLEGFRKLMSSEKQKRIEEMLAEKTVPTEKLEEVAESLKEALSQNDGTRSELEKAAALLAMIEQKVTADMFDEMAYEFKRKLPKLIKKYKEPAMVTNYWINLRDIVMNHILSSHGPLRCQEELEVMNKFAAVVTDFIIKIQLRSLRSNCPTSFPWSQPLRSVQDNEFLIKLADKLIGKLAGKQDLVQ